MNVRQIVEIITESLKPQKLFLFGSRAEGTATDDSDIDLVVVMPTDLPAHQRNLQVRRLFPRRSFALDAFVYTPEEYERYRNVPGTILYQATHHGKLLYG